MNITDIIQNGVIQAVKNLYGEDITSSQITMSVTRKEFEGDYTVVTFPFTRFAKKKPDAIAQELGDFLEKNIPQVERFNVIQGFLNLVVSDSFWQDFLTEISGREDFGNHPANGRRVMVEYCSPNTNKPLHLGHIRNILLGWSCSKLYEAAGFDVVKVQIINDRGIAICKSMLAWHKFAGGATPESTGTKGDHFVGNYYVMFEKKFREEYKAWQQSAAGLTVFKEKGKAEQTAEDFFSEYKNVYFNEYSQLGKEAREMLQRWEAGDPGTLDLWKKMNGWVYAGFEETYRKLGVGFDKYYYESETYLLGKDTVENGLKSGAFYKKEDGSAWVDLTGAKLDHKLLLRSDGTSVYITQDLGTAQMRYHDFGAEKMVYVVADEQNYHFQVLFEVLKRLGEPYADGLHHLSYGMVDLPTGKMKSREGTVVDADDLIAEVLAEANDAAKERGEITDLPKGEQEDIIRKIALAALKFHIIKVHPQKRMIFDPKESVDLQGQTGPYVQNAYVRIRSVLRKASEYGRNAEQKIPNSELRTTPHLEVAEKDLISQLYRFPDLVLSAANDYDPSSIANYCYDLAKSFHKFYTDYSILKAENEETIAFRLRLSHAIAGVLKTGMDLLGIEMPERM
jgi:arginyl-tRNA synthetase